MEASKVLSDPSKSMWHTADSQQIRREESSGESFSGFETSTQELFVKSKETFVKVAKAAEASQNEYRKLEESGMMDKLRVSVQSCSTREKIANVPVAPNLEFVRTTRSKGAPLDLPNVQPVTLERKRRNSYNC